MHEMKNLLQQLINGEDLSAEQMQTAMQLIMENRVTVDELITFMTALREKKESITEIVSAAKSMLAFATPLELTQTPLVDIVGTGGDQCNTFNISTTCCFVVACTNAVVAKHGNRSVSSKSGSADLLQQAGVNLDLTPDQVKQCIEQLGLGFLFAPNFHPAMRHTREARKKLGTRSIFNLLGPLTNPSNAKHQLFGVYCAELVEPLAKVLKELGSKHALVVHGQEGLDEISIQGETLIAELNDGQVNCYRIKPEDFSIASSSLDKISVSGPEQSLQLMQQVLQNKAGPALDIVLLNAGAAIYAADQSNTLKQGVEMAKEIIATGKALEKFNDFVALTQSFAETN